jgi:prepilin-type N-terminal cleavage/methylation domain-containing protein
MWKYKIKKGFTLLEVMISISVFSILFLTSISLQLNTVKIKAYNEKLNNSRQLVELVGNKLLYNSEYAYLKEIAAEKKEYINKKNLDVQIMRECDIRHVLESAVENSDAYIQVRITGEEVLKIELELHARIFGKAEVVRWHFFKGNY